jgi:hypothetical protein
MLACTSFTEERVEGIITSTDRLITGHLTIRLDTMLEAEELPACVTDLHTCLPNVNAKSLTHDN